MWYPGRMEKQEWTYDDAHNLVSHTTVGGKTEQFTYDIRNRKDTMTCTCVLDIRARFDDGLEFVAIVIGVAVYDPVA